MNRKAPAIQGDKLKAKEMNFRQDYKIYLRSGERCHLVAIIFLTGATKDTR